MTAGRRFSLYMSTSAAHGVSGLVTLLLIIPDLTVREIGFLAGLETITYLFAAVAGLGLDRAMARLYYDGESEAARSHLAFTLQCATFVSVAASFGVAMLLADAVRSIFPEIAFWPYIVLAFVRTALELSTRVQHSFFVARGAAGNLAAVTWIAIPINLAASLVLVLGLKMGLLGYLVGQAIGAASLLLLTQWRMRESLRGAKFDRNALVKALRYGWPFVPALLIAWVLGYTDRIFIDRYMSMEDLGVYGLALRFAAVFVLVSVALQKAIYPTYYRTSAQSPAALEAFSAHYISAVTLTAVLFMFALAWLLDTVFPAHFSRSSALLGFVVVTHWISVVGFLSAESIARAKKTGWSMVIGAILAVISLTLNMALVPVLGLYGAIAAGLVSGICTFALQLVTARKFVEVPIPWARWAGGLALVLASAFVVWTGSIYLQIAFFALAAALLARPMLTAYRFFATSG